MRRKGNKGITLIALVITIIVLLILAGVSIATLMGDNGLLTRASQSKEASKKGEIEDKIRLAYSEWKISQNVDKLPKTMEEILEKEFGEVVNNNDGTWMLDGVEVSINEEIGEILVGEKVKEKTIEEVQENYVVGNTIVKDENGNKIVVPDGFKITNDTKKVHEGIVITDGTNEFVWVPVGEISDGINTHTINLSRYMFATDGTPTDIGDETATYGGTKEMETSPYGNTTAKNLQGFIQSARANEGYYIGRYEASDSIATSNREESSSKTNAMTSKKDGFVYNFVKQPQAASLSRNMYTNSNFESDLVNSYAWDTLILFIQTFGQNNYSNQARLSTSLLKTGMAGDEQLHINDMAGNVLEWTTESLESLSYPSAIRGGNYNSDFWITAFRGGSSFSDSNINVRIPFTFIYIIVI